MASLQLSPRNRLRVPSCVNDNQCVVFVTRLKNSVYVSGQTGLNPSPVIAGDKKVTVTSHVDFCVANAHSVTGLPCKSQLLLQVHRNKICERCFLCRSLEFCKSCHKCPTCCYKSTCRGKATQFLGEMGISGFKSKSSHHTQRGLHPPLPVQTEPNQVTNCHKQLPEPIQQAHLLEALCQLVNKNAVEPVANQNSLGFYNRLFLVPKPNNRWRLVLDMSTLNTFLNTESFKMETPETIRTSLQSGEWVTFIEFKDSYFHIPIHSQSRK